MLYKCKIVASRRLLIYQVNTACIFELTANKSKEGKEGKIKQKKKKSLDSKQLSNKSNFLIKTEERINSKHP